MAQKQFKQKDSVVLVYTGDGKGKTSAALGLMARALGAGFKVSFVQFIKTWEVSEHNFIKEIMPVYKGKLDFYKGGCGFYNAGHMSSSASEDDHKKEAELTFKYAYDAAKSGNYQLVICDEINNAVHDGLLDPSFIKKLVKNRHPLTSLCLTGRNFSEDLFDLADIITDMTKIKHHFDDLVVANRGIDY